MNNFDLHSVTFTKREKEGRQRSYGVHLNLGRDATGCLSAGGVTCGVGFTEGDSPAVLAEKLRSLATVLDSPEAHLAECNAAFPSEYNLAESGDEIR